jgi:hypothetical protein
MRIYEQTWSIDAADWSVEHHPECVTLTPGDNDAALQVSSSWKTAGEVTVSEASGMAEQTAKRHEVMAAPTVCGQLTGRTVEFTDRGHLWRRWWLLTGERLLFVTYNTDAASRDKYRDVVDRLLSTLEAQDPSGDVEQPDAADGAGVEPQGRCR